MAEHYTIKQTAIASNFHCEDRIVAKIIRDNENENPNDYALILRNINEKNKINNLSQYAAVLIEENIDANNLDNKNYVIGFGQGGLGHLQKDDIVSIDPNSGFVRTIYRPDSPHNAIFATERCNSNCIMCSQPPKDIDDSYLVEDTLKMISLIKNPPETMGITGGEPLLLKHNIIKILQALKNKFPETFIHMLTNGRYYAYMDFAQEIANVQHPRFMSAIPLYADVASIHDYVVQAKGAFDQTIEGIYNANFYNLDMEIRVVLHKQTIPRLTKLCDFIYRNFPFVKHVALMGLENMGYVKKNWDDLWIDPFDYGKELEKAVKILHYAGMNVSIYNLQLCILPKTLWSFARASISDYKNLYLDCCEKCDVKKYCAGLFSSSRKRHSTHIEPQIISE